MEANGDSYNVWKTLCIFSAGLVIPLAGHFVVYGYSTRERIVVLESAKETQSKALEKVLVKLEVINENQIKMLQQLEYQKEKDRR